MRINPRKTSCVDLEVSSMGNAQIIIGIWFNLIFLWKKFEHLKQSWFFSVEKYNVLCPLVNMTSRKVYWEVINHNNKSYSVL